MQHKNNYVLFSEQSFPQKISKSKYMWILKEKTNGPSHSQYDIASSFDVKRTGWSNLHTFVVPKDHFKKMNFI